MTKAGWAQSPDSYAQGAPRGVYAKMVIDVCDNAARLVAAVLKKSFPGEVEETAKAMRKLANTRAPSSLSDDEREILSNLEHAIGSGDRDRVRGDPDSYQPRRDYGLMYNVTAVYHRPINTPHGHGAAIPTEDVEHGEIELAALAAIEAARAHFAPMVPKASAGKPGSPASKGKAAGASVQAKEAAPAS